jgi:hypothetical protein
MSKLQPKALSQATSSVSRSVLQRKCACGGTPGPTGECENCRKKREAREQGLQRAAVDQGSVSEVSPIIQEVLSSPGQPLAGTTRTLMEEKFG